MWVCYTNDTGINYDINLPSYRKEFNFPIVKKDSTTHIFLLEEMIIMQILQILRNYCKIHLVKDNQVSGHF